MRALFTTCSCSVSKFSSLNIVSGIVFMVDSADSECLVTRDAGEDMFYPHCTSITPYQPLLPPLPWPKPASHNMWRHYSVLSSDWSTHCHMTRCWALIGWDLWSRCWLSPVRKEPECFLCEMLRWGDDPVTGGDERWAQCTQTLGLYKSVERRLATKQLPSKIIDAHAFKCEKIKLILLMP